MKILTNDQINDKLEQIQPEGFDWTDPTDTELVKFRALLQAQADQDKAEHICKMEELASAYDSMIDNMGMGIDNFKQSDWNYVQNLIKALKKEG